MTWFHKHVTIRTKGLVMLISTKSKHPASKYVSGVKQDITQGS